MMTGEAIRLARTLRRRWYWGGKRFDEQVKRLGE
jgi:hypothetical protein